MDDRTVKTLDIVVGVIGLLLYLSCGCPLTFGGAILGAMGGLAAASGTPDSGAAGAAVAGGGALVTVLGISLLVGAVGAIGVIMQKRWGHMILVILTAIQVLLALISGSFPTLIVALIGVYCLVRMMGKLGTAPQ